MKRQLEKTSTSINKVLRLRPIRKRASEKLQRIAFDRAIQNFRENPWSALNSNSTVLEKLVYGWGNRSWSAHPEFIRALMVEFSRTAGPVLECGSGLTTIILGILAQNTQREVWTLEHQKFWSDRVLQVFRKLAITSVQLRVSPLKDYGDFSWYVPPLREMPGDFELIICDGPPGDGHGGRSGMLPVLNDVLSNHCTIVLDDLIREHEVDIANRWASKLGGSIEVGGIDQPYAVIRVRPDSVHGDAEVNQKQPLVTVGIPAYNSEEFIGQAIESILNQSYSHLSLIISDNASQDETRNCCAKYIRQDSRVQYYRQDRNIGVFKNYDEVFLKCRSKYFKWLSSSDWCDRTFLESCVQILEADSSVVLVCPSVLLVNNHGQKDPYDSDFGLEMQDPAQRFIYLLDNIRLCNLFNGVIRTDALRKTLLNKVFSGSDVVLLAQLALVGKFVLLPDRKWFRRMMPSTASKLQSAEQKVEFFSGEPEGYGKFENWKEMSTLTLSVIRSSVDIKTKLTCLKYLARKWIWTRVDLWRELWNR